MAATGKLEKMLILAFDTAEDAERGGTLEAKARFEALINPETYTLEYKVKTADGQGQGTSGAQIKFEYTLPEELTFDFLFDNTGLIDDKPKPDGVFDDVDAFRKLLTEYQRDSHEPYHLKLVWGNLIFKGRAIEVGITYKLFNPDGQPIRASCGSSSRARSRRRSGPRVEDRRSADLTHRRTVKPGDTLPFMCFEVYGDPRHYLFVADFNQLDDFRQLTSGAHPVPPVADPRRADERYLVIPLRHARRVLDQRAHRRHEISGEFHVLSASVSSSSTGSLPLLQLRDGEASKQTFEASDTDHFVPGKEIEIKLGYRGETETVFKGIIVKHRVRIRKNGTSCRWSAATRPCG